ncbi:coiled-coil domain-containing protein 30 isoform X2 [Acipenser ruthenus]|uniref:coiled-coil domain-containing protein 30 isoform X2 n=1 Tax=Acipenser ruthenus TaxID=7906 RepID=UPI0027417D03|nr:coiled-coil domain-containing protein 30 isoform X2 [Acipenser ruthenus]
MDNPQQEQGELDDILQRLREDGQEPGATADEQLRHLWRLYLRSEGSLRALTQDLEEVRSQQVAEMKEVENYVDHIRNLSEEREALTAEYERENEQLRGELQQLRLEQEAHLKEVEEMLDQEGLAEISHSSPSEQIAYLLVERATLLEKLESAERKLDSQSYTGSLREVHLQEELDQIRQTLEEELRQQRESMQRTKETMNKDPLSPTTSSWKKLFGVRTAAQGAHAGASVCPSSLLLPALELSTDHCTTAPTHDAELSSERRRRECAERDLDEASRRLSMAHEEIRRLTDEVDIARKASSDPELQRARQEVEQLRVEVEELKESDLLELQRVKEHNVRLDKEILSLRSRVRSLDSERKTLLQTVEKLKEEVQQNQVRETVSELESLPLQLDQVNSGLQQPCLSKTEPKLLSQDRATASLTQAACAGDTENDAHQQIHERCRQELQDRGCQIQELRRKLLKLQREHEELGERNEELESILGETQNRTKEERERFESETEGLHRKITGLDAELSRLRKKQQQWEGKGVAVPSSEMSDAEQALQQLKSSRDREAVLEGCLTEEKEWRKQLEADLSAAQSTLKKSKEELQRCGAEMQSLRASVEESSALNASLTQGREEKTLLERKVCELELSAKRLEGDVEQHRAACSQAKEELRKCREREAELRGELHRAEGEHSTLRGEVLESRAQGASPEQRLSESVQERLGLELQSHRLRQGTGREANPEQPQHRPSHRVTGEGVNQLVSLKVEMGRLQSTLEEERLLASQHQLALQAQIGEGHGRAKSQESLLQQMGEECRQLKQDLQRTQNLFSSAERELRYEREKNLDQKRHGALLEQENTKVKAELKQAQSRLAGVEQASASLSAELESSQQRGRELELELLHRTESVRVQRSLQEELRAESSRHVSADKKVRELQQQLKGAQHQLRLAETRVQEMEQLQREARDSTESLATLRGRLQEEQLCRKLLEQKGEELQQQLRLLREKEASLNRSNTELNHRLHQQGARLSVLEEEHSTVTDEHQHSQKTNQNLSDQLLSCQHESERLQEELRRVLHQLDSHVRRYSEKQARHKAKLRRAKEFFLRETVERDGRIRNLEKDLMLARSLTEKEQEWIRKVTDVNEKLLVEKRELLRRLSEEEELGQTCTRTISTRQHRLNCLEEENRQLQDRTLRLSNQVGALERALRSVQSVCSMEELKKAFPTESLLLNGSLLQPSNPSLMAGGCDTLGILDAIRRVKASEPPESLKSSFSTPRSQPSDIGYLNLSSPAARPGSQDPDESQSLGSDEV